MELKELEKSLGHKDVRDIIFHKDNTVTYSVFANGKRRGILRRLWVKYQDSECNECGQSGFLMECGECQKLFCRDGGCMVEHRNIHPEKLYNNQGGGKK